MRAIFAWLANREYKINIGYKLELCVLSGAFSFRLRIHALKYITSHIILCCSVLSPHSLP